MERAWHIEIRASNGKCNRTYLLDRAFWQPFAWFREFLVHHLHHWIAGRIQHKCAHIERSMNEVWICFATHRHHIQCNRAVASLQEYFQINKHGETRWILFDRQIHIRVYWIHEHSVVGEYITKCTLQNAFNGFYDFFFQILVRKVSYPTLTVVEDENQYDQNQHLKSIGSSNCKTFHAGGILATIGPHSRRHVRYKLNM